MLLNITAIKISYSIKLYFELFFFLGMFRANYRRIILLLMCCLLHTTLQAPSICQLEEFPRTRNFSSLEEYQGSRISFNPHHYGYQGNVVTFTFEKLETIPKNSFISFGSEGIVELHLENKYIEKIDVGAFLGLDCLNDLNLNNNNLKDLPEGAFEGLDRLKNLLLRNNLLQSTPDGGMAFLHLRSLKILDLSRNRIKNLQKISFDSLQNLKVLNLGYNEIRIIEDTIFNSLTNLGFLLLNNNYLTTIHPERWENLEQLTVLNLADNFLISFDTGYNFSFANLTKLNLSGNFLKVLNGIEIKRSFLKLEDLDIGNNPWLCKDLNAFRSSLVGSNIVLSPEIRCSKERKRWSILTPPPEDTPEQRNNSTLKLLDSVERNISKQIHDEINEGNTKLLTKIEYIQVFLTSVSVIAVMCFIMVLIVKLKVCHVVYNVFWNRQSHFNNSEHTPESSESYRLIGR